MPNAGRMMPSAAVFAAALSLTVAAASAADPIRPLAAAPGPNDKVTWDYGPIGVPLGEGELKIRVSLVIKGKLKTETITIPKGDIKAYVRPFRDPKDSDQDYANKLNEAKGKASQDKADVIAKAINDTFKLQGNDRAAKGLKPEQKTENIGGVPIEVTRVSGSVVIPNVLMRMASDPKDPPVRVTERPLLGEGGNRGTIIAPERPSPGMKSSLERSDPLIETLATGYDPQDDPSYVEFGLDGTYVAQVFPKPGMSDEAILKLLEVLLDTNGVPATYDPVLKSLYFNKFVPVGRGVVFGNTDRSLEFVATFDPIAAPEPATAAIVVGGALWSLRRLRRVERH